MNADAHNTIGRIIAFVELRKTRALSPKAALARIETALADFRAQADAELADMEARWAASSKAVGEAVEALHA